MSRLFVRTLAFVVMALTLSRPHALAAPGDLDPQFGGFGSGGRISDLGFASKAILLDSQGRLVIAGNSGGTFHVQRRSGAHFQDVEDVSIIIDSGQTSATARAVALAPDGKIVVAGSVNLPGIGTNFAVARLNIDLSLDDTFAGDGTTSSDFEGADDVAYAVIVQADSKVVVAGWTVVPSNNTSNDWGVVRFNENGTLDSSFDGNGKWTFDYSSNVNLAYALALDGDKILVAGDVYESPNDDFGIVRLNADGSMDDSFDSDGFARIGFGGQDEPLAIAVGPNHEVVVAGGTIGAPDVIKVTRLLANGQPDSGFSGDGRVTTAVEGNAIANGVVVQPDGKIVVLAVNVLDADPNRFLLARYQLNGLLDSTFGSGGLVYTDFGTAEAAPSGLALQPDGWFVAVGGPNAARYRSNGSLDSGGVVQVVFDPLQVSAQVGGLSVDSERRIIAGGSVQIGEDSSDIALARFSPELDGSLDTTYGNDDPKRGMTVTGTGLDEQVHALELEGSKAVVVGQIGPAPNINFLLGRYTSDGAPDASCALFGFNVQDFDGGDDVARAVGFGDGLIFVAGTATGSTSDYGVAPFNSADCTLNTGFGLNRVDLGSTDMLGGVAVQTRRFPIGGLPDPKAVLAGSTGTDVGLTRVESVPVVGGSRDVDTSFGTNGTTVVPTGGSETVTAMARQTDGSLIVGGWNVSIDNSDFFLMRFTSSGLLDTSFGANGVAYADFGVSDTAYAIAVRGDNTIALAGCNTDFGSRIAIAQFTPSGQLDTGFSDDGLAEVEIGGNDCARAVRFLPPNRVVVGGYANGGGNPSFVVAQLETTRDLSATTTTTTTTTMVTTTTLEPSEATCGDTNGDGSVTASDALFVLRAAVGLSTCQQCVCDVDASGLIAATDALSVLAVAVGQSVVLQCPVCS